MDYSVVIPCYNSEKTIGAAIDSVLAQSILPKKIIIVDDGSNDNTINTINSINNPLIQLIKFDINKGVSAARNAGWNAARSMYVAFLDSDDVWHPQKIAIINKYLPALHSPVFCHDFTYQDFIDYQVDLPIDYFTIERIRFRKFLIQNSIVSCSVIVRRDFPLRYDEKMRYCEDHDFLLRASYIMPVQKLIFKLARVNRMLNTKGGLSGNLWKMRQGELYMYLKLFKTKTPLIILSLPLMIFSLMKHVLFFIKKLK